MSPLVLTTSSMLFGLALLALPILAHLLNRKARERLVFPTIVLLSKSSASQSRLFKLRRVLLLLLRCLVVAGIVLAFARPVWRGGLTTPVSGAGAGVVLVADLSASTRQEVGGIRLIESLRAAGDRVLNDLVRGADAANLVVATARPRATVQRLTANVDLIREELSRLEPTAERADFPAALSLAAKYLHEVSGPRHLVILSDLQRSNWEGVDERLASEKPFPPDTRITIVPVDDSLSENVGLSAPSVSPAIPLVGRPARLTVKVTNFSAGAAETTIRAEVGRAVAGSQTVRLSPRQERELLFDVVLDRAGEQLVRFTSSRSDSLEIDNTAYLVVSAGFKTPVVIVSDEGAEVPGNAAYFLSRCLAPRGNERDTFEPRVLRGMQVDEQELQGVAAVLVARTERLPDETLIVLHSYVERGGGVLFFCGEGSVAENLARFDRLHPNGLLPWRVGSERRVKETQPIFLGEGDWQAAVLRDFDERSQLALSRIPVSLVHEVDETHPTGQIFLWFNDTTPALGRRAAGLGQVMLANFSPALGASDFGKYGIFVALTHSLLRELTPAKAMTTALTVGEPLSLTIARGLDEPGDESSPFRLIGPRGATLEAGEFYRDARGTTISLDRTVDPGFYVAVEGERPVAHAAANLDARESDLTRLEPEVLKRRLEAFGGAVAVRQVEDGESLVAIRGEPLWGWMLLVAMMAIGLELLVLSIWKH